MKRRDFITLLGGAAAVLPLAARGQQGGAIPRIGMLQPLAATDPEAQRRVSAFGRRLEEFGWAEGRNVQVEYGWAPAETGRIRDEAAKLVKWKPNVIVGVSTPVVTALRAETRSTPIVFVQIIDPVAAGFVASLARPGGNVTGVTNFEFSMGGKWLELLKEISAPLARVAVLYNPQTAPYWPALLRSIVAAGPSFGIQVTESPFKDTAEIEHAIAAVAQRPTSGLLVLPDASTALHRSLIIDRVAQYRIPTVYPFRYFALSGGLVSYGTDAAEAHRQVVPYVDRILRGTKPEDLPVQAPVKYELVINLKTAKALGLEVPPMLLARADEVIE